MKKLSGLQMTSNDLIDLIANQENIKFATEAGARKHAILQKVAIDNDIEQGDSKIIAELREHPELLRFFSKNAKTEVPIAGYINGKFYSRRIDRLIINETEKHIELIDYKTDLEKNLRRADYKKQIAEYKELLRGIYPDYKITGYILWLHDFCLEKCD